jgi:hypothetical protein
MQLDATSNAEWLHVTSGASGKGDGTFTFVADPDSGPARVGTLSAAGEIVIFSHVERRAIERTAPPSARSRAIMTCHHADTRRSWTATEDVPCCFSSRFSAITARTPPGHRASRSRQQTGVGLSRKAFIGESAHVRRRALCNVAQFANQRVNRNSRRTGRPRGPILRGTSRPRS